MLTSVRNIFKYFEKLWQKIKGATESGDSEITVKTSSVGPYCFANDSDLLFHFKDP